MAKVFKRLFISILVLAALLIAAAIVASRAIDTQAVKNLVEAQTQQATSLDMNFAGDLQWSFFPGIRLNVSNIELHTRQAYDGDTLFAHVGEAGSTISLIKLLRGKVSIDQLELSDIELRMVTDARGHSNWKDVEPASGPVDDHVDETMAESAVDVGGSSSASVDLVFGDVQLSNVEVSIIDLGTDTRQSLLIKKLEGRDINFSGEPFTLQSTISLISDGTDQSIDLRFASPFRFDINAKEFIIDNISGSIDQTRFSGSGAVSFGKDTEFTATLSLGTFDMNPYLLSTTVDGGAVSDSSSAQQASEDVELPLDVLHTLNVQLQLSIEKVIYEKTQLQNVVVEVRADNGVLNVDKLNASVYGGTINQSFSIDANRKPAALRASQNLSDIDLAALFASNEFEVGLEGQASITSEVTARGNSSIALKKTLSGITSAKLANGRYLDDNIEQRICQSIALARKTSLHKNWSSGTSLKDAETRIQWDNGVGSIQTFNAGLANASVSGEGNINLIDTSFDLRMLANISGDIRAAGGEQTEAVETGCEINEQYRNIAWPLRCQGNAEDNSCGIDNSRLDKILSNLAKTRAKEAVDKELDKQRDKLQEKLNEKLGDGVGDALRGLFR